MTLKINSGVQQDFRFVAGQAQEHVAIVVENAAHDAGGVVVIKSLIIHRQQPTADGALELLLLQANQVIPDIDAACPAARLDAIEELRRRVGFQPVILRVGAHLALIAQRWAAIPP